MTTKQLLVILVFIIALGTPYALMAQPDSTIKPASSKELNKPQLSHATTHPSAKKTKLEFKKKGGLVYKRGAADGVNYELACDVYIPEGDGPYPAILAVHGGSWTSGTKLHLLRHAWKMAQRGYVVVAINYRHAPRHKFPSQIHDCKQAVRWMRKNAEQFKIDPERIAGYGYSAGGHLVSLLGTTDQKDGLEGDIEDGFGNYSTRLQCVAAGGAPCEFEWVGSTALAFFIGATKNRRPKLYEKAAPTSYVDKDDPPFFLFHGQNDALVPVSSTLKMHETLKECGVECSHETIQNKGHFWTFSDFDVLGRVIDFFDEQLKPTAAKHP